MKEFLSTQQARKLVLLSQKLPPSRQAGNAVSATLAAITHLGYIQIDTISVIQRAHHHTLWNRNPRYTTSHLDQLLQEKRIFEYWSHAAAYLPMQDFRYSLVRKQAITTGEQDHWYERDIKLMRSVLARIASEGPLMAKDFEGSKNKGEEWRSKPTKQALEYLFMQGELMVPYRNNFHKVYDLTERVLPEKIDTTLPSIEEYGRFLVSSYLRANGIGQLSEMAYLLKNTKTLVTNALHQMFSDRELVQVDVHKKKYYALPESMELLSKPLRRSKLKILSPFDNLLIQRTRTKALFDFDYLLECYVPRPKRKYGYFSLPVLWNGTLVARMDCKAERRKKLLHIQNLVIEPKVSNIEGLINALCKELPPFLQFNGCEAVVIHRSYPDSTFPRLQAAVDCLKDKAQP